MYKITHTHTKSHKYRSCCPVWTTTLLSLSSAILASLAKVHLGHVEGMKRSYTSRQQQRTLTTSVQKRVQTSTPQEPARGAVRGEASPSRIANLKSCGVDLRHARCRASWHVRGRKSEAGESQTSTLAKPQRLVVCLPWFQWFLSQLPQLLPLNFLASPSKRCCLSVYFVDREMIKIISIVS